MIKVDEIIIGGLAGIGTITIIFKLLNRTNNAIGLKYMDTSYRPEKTRPRETMNRKSDRIDNKIIESMEEIHKTHEVHQETASAIEDDNDGFEEINKMLSDQKLYTTIIDFILKHKNLDIKDLKERCIAEHDIISRDKTEGKYGSDNQIMEDYLTFLVILKDRKEVC